MNIEDQIKAKAAELEALLAQYHQGQLPKQRSQWGEDTLAAELARTICHGLLRATDAQGLGGCPLCQG